MRVSGPGLSDHFNVGHWNPVIVTLGSHCHFTCVLGKFEIGSIAVYLINRLCVAGAVLQTPLSLINPSGYWHNGLEAGNGFASQC